MSSYTFQDTQQQQQPPQDFAEDKKCRICGYADIRNINIYSPRNCKQLVTKILAVYPIVLYENDPLPKNICRKCVNNVTMMYNDILRVMKMQIKWINNVRTVQPQHNYIRVLDQIQNANNVTRESIKATLAEDIDELSVSRLLFTNNMEPSTPPKVAKIKINTTEDKPPAKHTLVSFSMDYDDGVTRNVSRPATEETDAISDTSSSTQMKDIKSLLEQNGCSLLHLKTSKTTTTSKVTTNSSITSDCTEALKLAKVKEESIEGTMNDDNHILSIPSAPAIEATVSTQQPGPPPPLTVKCRLCPLQFNSLALLATHQVIHMRLCVPKIFQKKYLHKRVRRGRLISVQERKCIRCLNCWRVFVDNKSILEHWAMGECDFYCHICGKEFAQAPKMLREHVPAAHGISYRSSKFHRARLSTKIMMSMTQTPDENPDYKLYQAVSEQEPLPFEELGARMELTKTTTIQKNALPAVTKISSKSNPTKSSTTSPPKKSSSTIYNEDGSISCHICLKKFQNIKARNSHMRKHKPVYAYGDVVLPPLKGVNVNVKEEIGIYTDKRYETSTIISNVSKPQNPNYGSSTSQATILYKNTNIPNVSISSTATPLRGVRTKFVALRNDPNGANSGSLTALKVKPLNELQNPVASVNVASSSAWLSSASAPLSVAAPVLEIKSEPIDFEADFPGTSTQCTAQQETTFTCIPCSDQFSTKLELFRHKRKCRANYLFTCEYCSELFRCSADYQLHVAQIHRNSN